MINKNRRKIKIMQLL